MRALGQQFGEGREGGGQLEGLEGQSGRESESSEVCRAGYRACERKGRWWSEGVQKHVVLGRDVVVLTCRAVIGVWGVPASSGGDVVCW